MKPGAVFIGWQEYTGGAFPLFNITGEHERTGSTVGTKTLESLGIEVPEFPTLKVWRNQQRLKALDNVAGGGYAKGGEQ